MRHFVLPCLLVGGLLTSCTADGGSDTMQSPVGGSPTPHTATPGPPPDSSTFVRACDSSVFGELGSGWIRSSVVVGPIVFVNLRGYPSLSRQELRAPSGKARAVKVLLVVHGRNPVTLGIDPTSERASLLFDPERFPDHTAVPIARGDPDVRFEPCGGGPQRTQFNGAFILEGAGCVPVVVRTDDGDVQRRRLSFGAGRCP